MSKKVAMITSGGDASGINAVFEGLLTNEEIQLWGFNDGYDGICINEPFQITEKIVKENLSKGNSLLRTARSEKTYSKNGIKEIIRNLDKYKFDTLVVCGGEGSGKAANLISQQGKNTILVPMTIDNNIYGTDYTIGYYTACEYVANSIKRLRETGMNLPGRIFMLEVFGGDSGQLALGGAIAGGADYALLPEFDIDFDCLITRAKNCLESQGHFIILNCESNTLKGEWVRGRQGCSFEIGDKIEKILNKRVRYSILGYTQRTGNAVATDVINAIKIGLFVAKEIIKGSTNMMVGLVDGKIKCTKLEDVYIKSKKLIEEDKKIAKSMKIID